MKKYDIKIVHLACYFIEYKTFLFCLLFIYIYIFFLSIKISRTVWRGHMLWGKFLSVACTPPCLPGGVPRAGSFSTSWPAHCWHAPGRQAAPRPPDTCTGCRNQTWSIRRWYPLGGVCSHVILAVEEELWQVAPEVPGPVPGPGVVHGADLTLLAAQPPHVVLV